jgi:hypothetical protein
VDEMFPKPTINVVQDVVVKVEFCKSRLLIDLVDLLLPGDFRLLFGIEVDPYKAFGVYMGMDGVESILFLFESFQLLVVRRLRELPVQSV